MDYKSLYNINKMLSVIELWYRTIDGKIHRSEELDGNMLFYEAINILGNELGYRYPRWIHGGTSDISQRKILLQPLWSVNKEYIVKSNIAFLTIIDSETSGEFNQDSQYIKG